jgi:hypothetical protein
LLRLFRRRLALRAPSSAKDVCRTWRRAFPIRKSSRMNA